MVLYPGPRFLCSVAWPYMPKKHWINQSINRTNKMFMLYYIFIDILSSRLICRDTLKGNARITIGFWRSSGPASGNPNPTRGGPFGNFLAHTAVRNGEEVSAEGPHAIDAYGFPTDSPEARALCIEKGINAWVYINNIWSMLYCM